MAINPFRPRRHSGGGWNPGGDDELVNSPQFSPVLRCTGITPLSVTGVIHFSGLSLCRLPAAGTESLLKSENP